MAANERNRSEIECAEDAIAEIEGRSLLSTLQKATRPLDLACQLNNRKNYEARLLSFQASTYYAKPVCLSPIICARFGWYNADKDMLTCQFCKAALAIDFPPGLSLQALESICKIYRRKLAVSHHKHCAFRLEAEQHFQLTDDCKDSEAQKKVASVIPLAFANIFPRDFIDSIEHRLPSIFLAKRVRCLKNRCCSREGSLSSIPSQLPKFNIAEELQNFKLIQEEAGTVCGITKILLAYSGLLGTTDISVLLLVVLGWTLIDTSINDDGESQHHCVSLGCPLCFATMEINLRPYHSEARDKEDLSAKRQRKLSRYSNPYSAHRHYCPIRCGFPVTISDKDTPLWQVIIEQLETERQAKNDLLARDDKMAENTRDPKDAIRRIRKILLSGLADKELCRQRDYGQGEV